MEYIALGVLLVASLVAAVIDIKTRKIPNWIIVVLLVFWIVLSVVYQVIFYTNIICAFVVLVILLILLYFFKDRQAFGMGDIKLLTVAALYLGYPYCIICMFVACVAFIVFCLIKKKKSYAFAPFILAGVVICAIMYELSIQGGLYG